MDSEIKEILDYQTKLLEQIIMTMDETRHRSKQHSQNIGNMANMILNNPMLSKNPQTREFVSNMADTLKNMGADA